MGTPGNGSVGTHKIEKPPKFVGVVITHQLSFDRSKYEVFPAKAAQNNQGRQHPIRSDIPHLQLIEI
jgi:hypothetical protein